ncbi:MAG: beta-galactosidase [Solirubrobacteraceae bacterium]|jgi:beta-galactosidase|nr:beta-galactosidase [Solirubrobacteraceae bacterium]
MTARASSARTQPGARPRIDDGVLWIAGQPRLLLAGEYPYYRDDPASWEPKLRALRRAGIEVVSFYVPWRHHEVADGGAGRALRFDGDGNRDLVGFVEQIDRCGLLALPKPGPFVHAELQFGGLPDRISPSVDPAREAACSAAGEPLHSQRLALPSSHSAAFRADAGEWLRAVGDILRPFLHPGGPVVAVQVGNEGTYGEAALQIDAHDYCASAIAAFQMFAPGCEPPRLWATPATLDDLRPFLRWGEWVGDMIAATLAWFADCLGLDVPMLANMPPPAPADRHARKPAGRYDAWLVRNRPGRRSGVGYATTSWVGNALLDDEALVSHVLAATRQRGPNLEENWSLRWVDPLAAHANVPIFHALLGVACGATGIDVYTACATDRWGAHLAVDRDFLRETAGDPAILDPPYGDAAPVGVDGRAGPSFEPLRVLLHFLRATETDIVRARPLTGVTWCSYLPYAALSAWDLGAGTAVARHALPPSSSALASLLGHCLRRAIPVALADLEAATPDGPLALVAGLFMARDVQARLAAHLERGGALLVLGEAPELDERFEPCTTLAGALQRARAGDAGAATHVAAPGNEQELFDVVDAWVAHLPEIDARPADRASVELRLVGPGAAETFVFLFSRHDSPARLERIVGEVELAVYLAPYASAVVHVRDGRLAGCYVKGISEQAAAAVPVCVRVGTQEVTSAHACDLSAVLRSGRWDVRTSGGGPANAIATPPAD